MSSAPAVSVARFIERYILGSPLDNVLHDRSVFEETVHIKRLLYWLRYYQRIVNS